MSETIEFRGETIHMRGSIPDGPIVCVTGTRRATPYGLALARLTAETCVEMGLVVANGGAVGCEREALETAQSLGGHTMVFAATGCETPYPESSANVFAHADAVVSLEGVNDPPRLQAFPRRNAFMASTCDVTVMCECGMRSGTHSLSNHARAVLAFPGSVFSKASEGCNDLIASQQAMPVTSKGELQASLASLAKTSARVATPHPNDLTASIRAALRATSMTTIQLVNALHVDATELLWGIADLERRGEVVRLPDGTWSPSMRELMRQM